MAVEDLTTYTLTDPASRYAVTSSRITATSLQTRHETGYLVKDKGAAFFGNYDHLVTVRQTATGNNQWWACWAVSNTVGDSAAMDFAVGSQQVAFYGTSGGTSYDLYLTDSNGNSDFYSGSGSTTYYLRIQRVGTTATCKVYSDSGLTTLLKTLSITCVSTAWRYITLASTYNTAGSIATVSGYVENLDLSPIAPIPVFMNSHRQRR